MKNSISSAIGAFFGAFIGSRTKAPPPASPYRDPNVPHDREDAITAWEEEKRAKGIVTNEEVHGAAVAYKNSLNDLVDALAPYPGNTPDEKYANFLEAFKKVDTSHLTPVKAYKDPERVAYRKAHGISEAY